MRENESYVTVLAILNAALRFLLELCALVALGYGGYEAGGGTTVRVVLATGLPLAAAVLWGTFVAPKAPVHPPAAIRLALEILVLGGGAAALAAAGRTVLAAALAAGVALNLVLLRALHLDWPSPQA